MLESLRIHMLHEKIQTQILIGELSMSTLWHHIEFLNFPHAHPKFFFLNKEYTFEHFYFLNPINPSKIEKNIDPSDLPPKTPKNGGGSDTLNGLDFGYVSRREGENFGKQKMIFVNTSVRINAIFSFLENSLGFQTYSELTESFKIN